MDSTWQPWSLHEGVRDVESLVGWTVEARDGDVGKIDDASLDAGEGALVVAAGPVLLGHMVLLPAGTVVRVDREHRRVHVDLTREQIEQAPRRRAGMHLADEAYREEVAEYYRRL
ncbi:PRC-barrel domain-containing protein [Georgenia sp. SUBG003]|uniref:PRC-barrel domain-containing protein n=1 Tax=Georgenia sp. SUBG003 TaxID=1497974 RepID=UPI0004D990FE|nr:hypothetical protein DA06_15110 [Georgenia sp. SUBG003]